MLFNTPLVVVIVLQWLIVVVIVKIMGILIFIGGN